MTYLIEKGIPFPVAFNKRAEHDYPLLEMDIGDSFLLSRDGWANYRERTKIMAIAKGLRPKRFATRKVSDGVRVWRIE